MSMTNENMSAKPFMSFASLMQPPDLTITNEWVALVLTKMSRAHLECNHTLPSSNYNHANFKPRTRDVRSCRETIVRSLDLLER